MTVTKNGVSFPDITGSKKIRNPHACFEATRCSLTCTSWPLPPGQRFNASGASFLVAPSARGSCWLGGDAGRQKQVLRSTPHLSSAHLLPRRCSPEAALPALVHALTARGHQFSAWHIFIAGGCIQQAPFKSHSKANNWKCGTANPAVLCKSAVCFPH